MSWADWITDDMVRGGLVDDTYYNPQSLLKGLVVELQYKIGLIHPDLDVGRVRFKNDLLALCPTWHHVLK